MNERGKSPVGEGRVTIDQLPKEARAENGMFDWDYFEAHPEMIVPEALNNFAYRFPGGATRNYFAEIRNDDPDFLDETPRERISKRGEDPDLSGHSIRRLDQTNDEFWKIVDRVSQEVGLDLKKIEEEIKKSGSLYDAGKHEESHVVSKHINEMILPVYKRLREMGYSHKDLVQ